MEIFWRIWRESHSSLVNFEVNRVSQSEIIFFGIPNLGYTYRRYNPATPSAVIVSWQGMKMAALLQSWSMIVKIVSYFPDFGNFTIKSMDTVWKGSVCSGVMGIIAGFRGRVFALLA